MNEKQQQLLFDKGITNLPSDALCSDNTLSNAENLIYRDGEHRVIQKPASFMTGLGTSTIVYVHKYNNDERYICLKTASLKWGTRSQQGAYTEESSSLINSVSGSVNVTSIGKTLIISDNDGLHYFLWQEGSYKQLSSSIPFPVVELKLTGINDAGNHYVANRDISGMLYEEHGVKNVAAGQQENWNNAVVGAYAECKKQVHQKKLFWGSFVARVALRLYDGSYYHISNPILMMNKFAASCIGRIDTNVLQVRVSGQELHYALITDYNDWRDIVSDVVLFVSQEQELFDTSQNAIVEAVDNPIFSTVISGNEKAYENGLTAPHYKVLQSIGDDEINKNLVESGLFYELCSLGLNEMNDYKSTYDLFNVNTLNNITTQLQLPNDDYYSNCKMVPKSLYAYNSRLNMANVSRGFFSGFYFFMPYDAYAGQQIQMSWYDIYVTIETDSGNRVVRRYFQSSQKQGIWFYYPDPRAKHVSIYKGAGCILDENLKEHPRLNGAYFFKGALDPDPYVDDEPGSAIQTGSTTTDYTPEILPNYIIQSEANNPFVFNAAGYFKVGTGKILAMSSITHALSEGQFGQFPLLVFSDSGIWALSVASTGYYSSIHPMSREVSLDPACIIQTDGAIFFTSAKGLMVVAGSQVKCVSEQLSGRMDEPFADFLKTAFIAYDYRDSLLWIFDGATHNLVKGSRYCWIYSIKSGAFGRYDFTASSIITNAVSSYPDYLLQSGTTILSLVQRPDINLDGATSGGTFTPNLYSAKLVTRPLKLENALALKTIMQARHIREFNPYEVIVEDPETHTQRTVTRRGTMTWQVEASNNMETWLTLSSLTGKPWKYYRFTYTFSNLRATDTFAGTVLITQERRTNKLR